MPRALWWSKGGGLFLMGEVNLHRTKPRALQWSKGGALFLMSEVTLYCAAVGAVQTGGEL